MRLDRFFSETKTLTRKETALAASHGRITVNGLQIRRADMHIDPSSDRVQLDGKLISSERFFYFLMHKPSGVVSSRDEAGEVTVLDLLTPAEQKMELFPCGRLDKNTTGLLLLTNDGQLAHRLLSPRCHVEKDYRFCMKYPLSDHDIATLESGVDIGNGLITLPCRIQRTDTKCGIITLTEGKYHQIKKMAIAVHNQITALCRIRFGPLQLGEELVAGTFRPLTEAEIDALRCFGAPQKEKEHHA